MGVATTAVFRYDGVFRAACAAAAAATVAACIVTTATATAAASAVASAVATAAAAAAAATAPGLLAIALLLLPHLCLLLLACEHLGLFALGKALVVAGDESDPRVGVGIGVGAPVLHGREHGSGACGLLLHQLR